MIEVLIHSESEPKLFDEPSHLATAWHINRHPACRVTGIAAECDSPTGYEGHQVAITVDADRFDAEIEQLVRDAIATNIGARSFSIRELN